MNTNERIAVQMGWEPGNDYGPPRDYEHSLDALLEPLGVLEGYSWGVGKYRDDSVYVATLTRVKFGAVVALHSHTAATPSEALALAVADALEGTLP